MKIYRVQLNDEQGTVWEFTTLKEAKKSMGLFNDMSKTVGSPIRAKLIKP